MRLRLLGRTGRCPQLAERTVVGIAVSFRLAEHQELSRRALRRNQDARHVVRKAAGLIWSSVECRDLVLTKETRLFILFLRSIWILI